MSNRRATKVRRDPPLPDAIAVYLSEVRWCGAPSDPRAVARSIDRPATS